MSEIRARRKLKVLIAEPSLIVGEAIGSLLSETKDDLAMNHAQEPLQTLALIENWVPDAVLLSSRLFGPSNAHVIELIRQAHPKVTLVVLSNVPSEAKRKRFLDAGAHHFFDQNSELDQMAAVVDELRRRATQE